ncbi:MAG: DUF4276 family protein [Magnetococcales bacterium]|nr:DUF4276 family protein [Magnetococcales bacterium]
MHLEILIEDQSGKHALAILLPKLLGEEHSWRIIAYKGIGHLPGNLQGGSDPERRMILNQLPRLLQGYGNTYPPGSDVAVLVVVDLDQRCQKAFRQELLALLQGCDPAPQTMFCLAVEELEAWYLGDRAAILTAYPDAKKKILNKYRQDSICATWETVADALYPGGAKALSQQGYPVVGREKSLWAEKITPHMQPESNQSPSFAYFCQAVQHLCRHKTS